MSPLYSDGTPGRTWLAGAGGHLPRFALALQSRPQLLSASMSQGCRQGAGPTFLPISEVSAAG